MKPLTSSVVVIPGRRVSAGPGIHNHGLGLWIPGSPPPDLGFTRDRRSMQPKSAKADLGGAPE